MQGWAGTIIYLVIFFGILYFLMIRPQQQQQKKRKEMLSDLQANDRVVTIGGIHGRVTQITDNTVNIRIADKLEVTCDRGAIGRVLGKEE